MRSAPSEGRWCSSGEWVVPSCKKGKQGNFDCGCLCRWRTVAVLLVLVVALLRRYAGSD